jgi:hypothetical protein
LNNCQVEQFGELVGIAWFENKSPDGVILRDFSPEGLARIASVADQLFVVCFVVLFQPCLRRGGGKKTWASLPLE